MAVLALPVSGTRLSFSTVQRLSLVIAALEVLNSFFPFFFFFLRLWCLCVCEWVCACDARRGKKCGIPLKLVTVRGQPPDGSVQALGKRDMHS